MNKERLRVGISEYRVAESPTVLVTYGLGSCLGIALYDAAFSRGALAHTLLPTARPGIPGQREKFVDEAIEMMIAALLAQGSRIENLTAKLVGGATMFEPLHGGSNEPVGIRNAGAAREVLGRRNIPILAEDVGGCRGRTMEFDLSSGIVAVKSVHQRNQIIQL